MRTTEVVLPSRPSWSLSRWSRPSARPRPGHRGHRPLALWTATARVIQDLAGRAVERFHRRRDGDRRVRQADARSTPLATSRPHHHRVRDPRDRCGDLFERTFSFLWVGVARPAPSWGGIIIEHVGYYRTYPRVVALPCRAIMATILAFNLLADALAYASTPATGARLRGRRPPTREKRRAEPCNRLVSMEDVRAPRGRILVASACGASVRRPHRRRLRRRPPGRSVPGQRPCLEAEASAPGDHPARRHPVDRPDRRDPVARPSLGYDVTSWPAERLMFEALLETTHGKGRTALADGAPTVSADARPLPSRSMTTSTS